MSRMVVGLISAIALSGTAAGFAVAQKATDDGKAPLDALRWQQVETWPDGIERAYVVVPPRASEAKVNVAVVLAESDIFVCEARYSVPAKPEDTGYLLGTRFVGRDGKEPAHPDEAIIKYQQFEVRGYRFQDGETRLWSRQSNLAAFRRLREAQALCESGGPKLS